MQRYSEIKNFLKNSKDFWDIFLKNNNDPNNINLHVSENSQNENIILNLSNEPYNSIVVYDLLHHLQKKYNKVLILTGNLEYWYNPHPNIKYFPYFLYKTFFSFTPTDVIKNNKRDFIVSCLNGRSRKHRIENYIKLLNKEYFDKIYINLHNNYYEQIEKKEYPTIDFSQNHILDKFNTIKHTLPLQYEIDLTTNNVAWRNSYVSLITDTSVYNLDRFISEKTFKPLKSGMFPLYISNVGTVKWLREIGFDMFDDYIDHSYDDEPNWHKRIEMVHQQLDKLIVLDWENIFSETEERRLNNHKLFHGIELLEKLTQHIDFDVELKNVSFVIPKENYKETYKNLLNQSLTFWDLFDFNKTNKFIIDIEKIKSIISDKKLIVNLSDNPWDDTTAKLKQTLQQNFDNFLILTGDCNYFNKPESNIAYFPYWFLQSQKYIIDPTVVKNNYRHYTLSCINGRPRTHRIENYIKSLKKPWFNNSRFTMSGSFDEQLERNEKPNLKFCDDTILIEYLKIKNSLDQNYIVDHSPFDDAYTNSYINLITETMVNSSDLLISEKSWKPFQCGQLGLFLANSGVVNFLRNIGFDLFDDIIDHRYDISGNWHKRIDMIHSSIDEIYLYNWKKLYKDLEERRFKNHILFYSKELAELLTTQIPENYLT